MMKPWPPQGRPLLPTSAQRRRALVLAHSICLTLAAGAGGYIWGFAPWPYLLLVGVLWLGNLAALLGAMRS